MLKKFFRIFISIYMIGLKPNSSECSFQQRQKILLSFSRELFIKNFIIIKQPSNFLDDKIILFAKVLSQLNVYISCRSAQNVQTFINDNMGSKVSYLKTMILAFEEKFNREIFKLIEKNEKGSAKFIWLVWENDDVAMIDNKTFYIPYNSQFLIVENENGGNCYIREMYHPSLFSQNLFKGYFGIWSENKGLEVPEKDLYKRRFDMNQTELIILIDPEFLRAAPQDYINTTAKAMNFRMTFILGNDSTLETDEEWDVYLVPIILDDRPEVFYPLLGLTSRTSIHMYIRYGEIFESYGNSPYFQPFSKRLWLTILLSISLAGICTFVLLYVRKRSASPFVFQFLTAFYRPLDAFLNQCGSEMKEAIHIRIVIIITRLTALFLIPAYSAFLMSFILYPNLKFPFTDIKGLVQDKSYKIGFPKLNNWDAWFRENNDPWKRIAYEKYSLKPNKMPESSTEVMERICRNQKVAFILEEEYINSIRCKIVKIPTPILTGWYASLLRLNSSYEKIFNRIFKMFHSTGILDKHKKENNMKQFLIKNVDIKTEQNPVKLKNIERMLKLIAILATTSVLILLFECLYKQFQSFRDKKVAPPRKIFL